MSPDLSTKRLELLKEAVPKVSRVAVLWNAANRGKLREFKYTQTAANALRLQLQSVEVRRPDDLEHAFSAIKRERADALLLLPEGLVNSRATRIADFTLKNRLPAIHQVLSFADAGGLMVYGPNDRDLYRRAATYVDKILKGAKPSDLPIERPTKFNLVVNLKTAKQLGITIPPEMLFRADKVIK
jgi:putative ABC transport system substrate-binding protein